MGRGSFRFREAVLDGFETVSPPASTTTPAVAGRMGTSVELLRQEPPMADRDEVVFLLHTAAEIEHSLLAQYLYAAYSLARGRQQRRWRSTLVGIAREEMAHLLSIQNILRTLGGPLNFEREDHPFNVLYPFPFQLERFSLRSIARYVLAEMPDPATIPPELGFDLEQVKRDAEVAGSSPMVNRVGALFALLFQLVERLSDQPSGPAQRADFRPETLPWQGSQAEGWAFPGMIVEVVRNKADVLDLVAGIGEQGEGPGEPQGEGASHFRKFFKIYTEIKANPAQAISRPVPLDPTTQRPADGAEDPGYISNDLSRAWADLFNTRYRMLLADLAHLLTLSSQDQEQSKQRRKLIDWVFVEMNAYLAQIAEILATSPQHDPPRHEGGEQQLLLAAGPPFQLPYTLQLPDQPIDRWRHHEQLLVEAALRIASIKEKSPEPHPLLDLDAMRDADEQDQRFVQEQIRSLSEEGDDTGPPG